MHGHKSSLQWEVWFHKTGGLTPSPFIEAHLTSQESKLSCRCVRGIDFDSCYHFRI